MAKPALVAKSVQRTGALTTTYDTTPTCIPVNTQNQAYLAVSYTKGSSTGAILKVEFSFDDTSSTGNGGVTQTNLQALTYFRKCQLATTSSNGTNTQDAQFTLNTIEIALPAGSDNYLLELPSMATAVRVNAKALTSGTSTALSIWVVSGNTF